MHTRPDEITPGAIGGGRGRDGKRFRSSGRHCSAQRHPARCRRAGTCQRDWYVIAEQPAPAPHLVQPEGCAALRIVLVTGPCASRSCENLPDGFDRYLLPSCDPQEGIIARNVTMRAVDGREPATNLTSEHNRICGDCRSQLFRFKGPFPSGFR